MVEELVERIVEIPRIEIIEDIIERPVEVIKKVDVIKKVPVIEERVTQKTVEQVSVVQFAIPFFLI